MSERDRLLYELPTNVVVSAGAGTGKTHRLTGVYVHLVAGLTDLGGVVAPDAIVATTFTREAAAEMRARIESRLRLLATTPLGELCLGAPDVRSWATELAQTCARRQVSAPPSARFSRALDALPRGTITTFHAWAGELVRAHPIEARVPPGFDLIEPDEADAMVLGALRGVQTRWLADDTPVAVSAEDAALGVPVLPRRDAMRSFLAAGLERLDEAVLRTVLRAAEEGLDWSRVALADDVSGIGRSDARVHSFVGALIEAAEEKGKKKAPDRDAIDRVKDAVRALSERGDETRVGELGNAAALLLKAIPAGPGKERARAFLEAMPGGSFAEKAERIAEGPSVARSAVALGHAARAILAEVARDVGREKARTRTLDFGDVMRKARDLLRAHPEIQAEVASSIRALLVDEFQDTNALQRDLVYLVRQRPEAIAAREPGETPAAGTLAPRGLFVVGDRKQSIYGFRGADVGVFQQMALDIAGDEARVALGLEAGEPTLERPQGRLVTLDENRRSVEKILRFVNAAAIADMQGDPALPAVEQVRFQPGAESLRPVRRSTGVEPRVVVPRIVAPKKDSEDEDQTADQGEITRDLSAALALAAELRRLLDAPAVHGLPETTRPRDVAILIKTYAILPSLELALACHGVDYAVSARRGLYRTPEAADLEAFVRLCIDRHDRNALLAVLRGPWVALSDTALLELSGERGLTLPETTPIGARLDEGERARLSALRDALGFVDEQEPIVGAGPALRKALSYLGVENALALLPRAEQRIGDLRRLLEISDEIALSGSGIAGVARHLTLAQASAASVARARKVDDARGAVFDRDDDVVRVMTVHASKGLEFPVVAVMQLEHAGRPMDSAPIVLGRARGELALAARVDRRTRGAYGDGGSELVKLAQVRERAERQRLTYVALTRARDLLWVIAGPSTQSYAKHTAAHAVHVKMDDDDDVFRRVEWQPRVGLENDERGELTHPPTERPVVAFGEGPIPISPAGAVVVTTALADFAICARRYRLRHLVGLGEHPPRVPRLPFATDVFQVPLFSPALLQLDRLDPTGDERGAAALRDTPIEPALTLAEDDGATTLPVAPPPLDPRAQGVVAHLALERAPLDTATGEGALDYAIGFLRGEGYDPDAEPGRLLVARIACFLSGSYASDLAQMRGEVDVHRELPFVVPLPCGALLRGTIDFVAVRLLPSGETRVEIIDYKLGAGTEKDVAKHALQLRSYAAAASILFPSASTIVAGIAFLGSGDGTPRWLDGGANLGTTSLDEIDRVARRLVEARIRDVYPPIPKARCVAVGCGYRPLCHPRPGDAEDVQGH